MSVTIYVGDCGEVLGNLPEQSVHCVVTSPPYWCLRDYGIEGQLGLEATPEEYVVNMVAMFREVRRVLRDDGTLWLNLGDSYAAAAGGGQGKNGIYRSASRLGVRESHFDRSKVHGLKPKDLVGIPWSVAFALRADGWWLRQDIIWAKPSPMPESVRDRCTKAHEYVFLLAKSERYYYDAEAISEPSVTTWNSAKSAFAMPGDKYAALVGNPMHRTGVSPETHHPDVERSNRNRRTVWTIASQPFEGAHFATFPPALVEPCILAGCPEGGVVLDPFSGAGTTGLVADRLGRSAILIELSQEYAEMARERIRNDAPMFAHVEIAP